MEEEKIVEEFQWTFTVKDVVQFEETSITIYAETYEKAIRKVRKLKLPSLRSFDDIEENIKLASVYEINPYYDAPDDGNTVEHDD